MSSRTIIADRDFPMEALDVQWGIARHMDFRAKKHSIIITRRNMKKRRTTSECNGGARAIDGRTMGPLSVVDAF